MMFLIVLACIAPVIVGIFLFVGACMAVIEAGRHPID